MCYKMILKCQFLREGLNWWGAASTLFEILLQYDDLDWKWILPSSYRLYVVQIYSFFQNLDVAPKCVPKPLSSFYLLISWMST